MTGLFPACKQESQLSPDSIKSEEEANKMLSDSFGISHLPQDARILTGAPTYTGHLSRSLLSLHYHSFLHSMKSLAQAATGFVCFFLFQLKVKSGNYCFLQTAQGYQTTVGPSRS